ncbi:hypothetical protein M9H77_14950 [Catharanthus roseus]|uniref:Uncharacterized protein n=1 Tax=Catharanthus roseus TaxID=4058 RepID=A0ACC0BPK6_CATRO|nr:hypothetical protein M9H77_14950 [Catharanthus roseus]
MTGSAKKKQRRNKKGGNFSADKTSSPAIQSAMQWIVMDANTEYFGFWQKLKRWTKEGKEEIGRISTEKTHHPRLAWKREDESSRNISVNISSCADDEQPIVG